MKKTENNKNKKFALTIGGLSALCVAVLAGAYFLTNSAIYLLFSLVYSLLNLVHS